MKSSTFFIFLVIFIAAVAGAIWWSQKSAEKKSDLFNAASVPMSEQAPVTPSEENSTNINISVTQ